MTNFRMSLRLSVALVLALAFCCLAFSGMIMAKENKVQTVPGADGVMTATSPTLAPTAKAPEAPSSVNPFADVQRIQLNKKEQLFLNAMPGYDKDSYSGRPNVVRYSRVQGDAIADPFVIAGLPYNTTGSTDGFVDDYDVACTYSSTSPDVVYSFVPGADMTVDIDLCASGYDTKVFVFETDETTAIACDDDACGSPGYQSHLTSVVLTAGTTYFIVVDGYDGDYGVYDLTVTEVIPATPCGVVIPVGAIAEGGNCGDVVDLNGGCNEDPYAFGDINCGETVTGTLFMDGGTRDLDWYLHTFDDDTLVTFTGEADLPANLVIWDMTVNDCDAVDGPDLVTYVVLEPCVPQSIEILLPAGDYIFFIGGTAYEGYPCGTGPWNYYMTLEGDVAPAPPVPANDLCADAIAIGDGTYTFQNESATTTGIGTHTINKDVFYCYTATLDGEATFDMCGSDFDTKIAVWDGCTCDPVTELGYDDDGCPGKTTRSLLTIPVVNGNTYLVQCGAYSANFGSGELVVTSNTVGPADPGTNCDYPLVVNFTGTYEDLAQTTCGFGDDYEDTDMGYYDGGDDFVYELVIPTDMCVDITVDPLGTAWSGAGIFSDCPNVAGSLIAGVGNSSATTAYTFNANLTAGTYYLMVDIWPTPECYGFDLTINEVTCPDPLANDDCADAIEVFDGYNGVFNNTGATHANDSVMADVWYKYTSTCNGTATGTVIFDLCDSDLDTKMGVYYAPGFDCSSMMLLALVDDECGVDGWRSQAIITGVPTGTEFLLRVGGYNGSEGDFVINISCEDPPEAPANDNCADLLDYYGGALPVLTEGSPIVWTGTNEGCTADDCSMLGPNVWEAFTIDTCMNIEINYCGTTPPFGSVYIVMEAECPCNTDQSTLVWYESSSWDDCPDGENWTGTWVEVPAGTYYFPVNYDYSTANGEYLINVIGEICPPYCGASASSAYEYISRVEFNTINNSSAGDDYADYYEDGPNQLATTLYKGVNGYDLTVESTDGYSSDQVSAFIDWNIDYVFDPLTESIAIVGNPGYGPFTGVVDCPITAVAGASCLRVRLNDGAPADPCGVTDWGEVEDYRIDIMDLPCGDVNVDAAIDMVDVNILIDYYFNDPTGAIVLLPITANGDVNGDCCVNIADIVMLAEYIADPGTAAAPICLPCTM